MGCDEQALVSHGGEGYELVANYFNRHSTRAHPRLQSAAERDEAWYPLLNSQTAELLQLTSPLVHPQMVGWGIWERM